ncbi:GrpB family protein [Rhizobium mongolense]|uniref:GrpB family protein n=1 Tax=Rhizobium mongolense TaxID=57676 RepID=UPI0035563D05
MAERVEIVTYDKQWPGHFRDIAESLRALIGPEVIAIDHKGSTAVPGLSAKPLIDIDVTLPSPMTSDAADTITEANRCAWNAERFDAWISAFGSVETVAARIVVNS